MSKLSSEKVTNSQKTLEVANIVERILELLRLCKAQRIRDIETNKDFLEVCGLNTTYISDLKSGSIKNPSAYAIGSIALGVGANLGWIYYGEGEPFVGGPAARGEFQTRRAFKIQDDIVKYLTSKKLQASDNPPRTLLLAFRDQLESVRAQDHARREQIESMLHLIGLVLDGDPPDES